MENQRSSDGASSSSTAAVDKYDVFINHRGEVKKNFAGHLYRALLSGGFTPFLDQQDLEEGLPFPSQLEAVIRNASVYVAVFSPKYAESRWCLDELLLMQQSGAPIIPVFYHINPADLRRTAHYKTEGYGLSLDQLELKTTLDPRTQEEKSRYDPATIHKWRDALSSVADISGFDLDDKYDGDEVHMIDKIVERVGKIIRKPGLYVAKYPTGLNDKVTDFEATVLKQQQAGKIQVAGIVGLGGMGKTTLALELFNRMSSKYNKSFFLSDVREKANKTSLHSVQRELLRGLTQREVDINNIYEGIGMFEKHLKSAHVLLILDDIDHDNQLEALLPVKDVLSPNSFILITSRYKDVLERSRVEELCIYKLTGLPRQYSQQLFCSYAFRQTNPLHGFVNLVDQFLQVCDGLPLALKVLGALLFGKPESHWDAKLSQLKVQTKVSTDDIKNRLKISYDALSEEERKIFLDIAFCFIGENKTSAIAVWDASGWNGLMGLTNLEGKCLVEVDDKNVIRMHDQLRDLGRQIAEEETPRRLWRPTGDIDEWLHKYSSVLTEARGFWLLAEGHSTKQAGNHVILKLRNWLENICYCFLGRDVMNFHLVKTEGHLLDRILRVHSPNLSWLSWRHCPYTCLPSWITLQNLRVLKVESAVLKTLWQGISQAPLQLQELDLSSCTQLERLPDSFGSLSNLHSLDLSWCEKLERLPDSFGSLSNLHSLDLRQCGKLERLPDSFGSLSNLHTLALSDLVRLERLPDSFGSLSNLHSLDLRGLDLDRCRELERLPDSFGSLSNLHRLDLRRCRELERLPDSFGSLSNLHSLELSGCEKLERLPDSFGSLSTLHSMDLSECKKLERLPDSFGSLSSLGYFNASCCANLTISSEAFGNIRTLELIDLSGCEKVEVWPSQLGHQRSLKVLKLLGTNLKKELPSSFELPSDLEVLWILWIGNPLLETVMPSLGHLRKLKELRLEYRGELKCFSASVEGSSQLSWLRVSACPIIHTSEVLSDEVVYPNLSELMLEECINLVEVGTLPKALTRVKFSGCYNLRSIQGLCGLAMLQSLHIEKCNELEELPSVETMVSLEHLLVADCLKLRSIRDLAQLTKLRGLIVEGCPQLGELEGVECCQSLKDLDVRGCPKLRWDERVVLRLQQQCDYFRLVPPFRLEEPNGNFRLVLPFRNQMEVEMEVLNSQFKSRE
eukprot:PITA_26341